MPSRSTAISIFLTVLIALWGLTAVPQSLAACINAQSNAVIRWDPILHQRWLTTTDCEHPERPAQGKLLPASNAHAANSHALQPNAPITVHAGDQVSLWSQEDQVRIETTAIAEESGATGDTIRVRLLQAAAGEQQRQFSGTIRGPYNVEMQP